MAESSRLVFESSEARLLGDFGDLVEALAPLGDLEGLGDLAGGLRDRFRFISATFSVGDRFEKSHFNTNQS